MGIGEALYDFFARRIAERGTYGPVEYLVYGAIMLLLAFLVIFPVLDRRGVKFNARFLLSLLPYILLGAALRVLEDMALLPRSWNPMEAAYYLVTPGIYLLIAAVTLAALFASLLLSKRFSFSFHKAFAGIGLAFAAPIVFFELLQFQAWLGFLAVLALTVAVAAAVIFLFKKLNSGLLQSRLNRMVLFSQVLDSSATFIATQFFLCGEQHPLSGFFLDFFPPSFILVKLGLVLAILYYVDKSVRNRNLAGFIKVVVAILGFATGLRDLLTLGVGTCL